MAVAEKRRQGRWESTTATARRLKTTPDEVRRRIARHELVAFQVRTHGRWYVTTR